MTVSVPIKAITSGPEVQWNHIDGPLMHWAGQMHWLTWGERFAIRLRRRTVDEVAAKRFPHLDQLRRHYAA
jgi:hypothetical protein